MAGKKGAARPASQRGSERVSILGPVDREERVPDRTLSDSKRLHRPAKTRTPSSLLRAGKGCL